jgi:hypothetical protein
MLVLTFRLNICPDFLSCVFSSSHPVGYMTAMSVILFFLGIVLICCVSVICRSLGLEPVGLYHSPSYFLCSLLSSILPFVSTGRIAWQFGHGSYPAPCLALLCSRYIQIWTFRVSRERVDMLIMMTIPSLVMGLEI